MRWGGCGLGLAVTLLAASNSEALCAAPWQRLPEAGSEVLRPLPLALLGAAAVPPLVLAPTGVDYDLRVVAQDDLGGSYRPESVSLAAPYVVFGGTALTWGVAAVVDDCDLQKAPAAMLQGMAATLAAVSLTKWATGRTWPNGGRDPDAPDRLDYPGDAQDFEPFAQGLGAFPSGHTAVMFAAAAALRTSSPELRALRYVGYPLALGVGFGMWYGDNHWASDVLSGALVGEALGGSAGRAWSSEEHRSASHDGSGLNGAGRFPTEVVAWVEWGFVPLPRGGALGLAGSFY